MSLHRTFPGTTSTIKESLREILFHRSICCCKYLGWSFFAKIVNVGKPLTIFVKSFILDVRLCSKYAPGLLMGYQKKFFQELIQFAHFWGFFIRRHHLHCVKYRNFTYFMMCKFCEKAQFSHSFGAFPQNFHPMKLG